MAIGYTELDFVNGSAPALSAANLNHIDEALKDACDLLDAETVAGRALATAADVAAQRSALGLGDSATKNVGTGSGDVAAGNAPAGAVTTHESTYAHANLPTAAGKTAADAIGAATGATTALKLANLASPASPTQQGVALLGASGGAAKLTKMPDGATAVFANDDWTNLTGVTFSVLSPSSGSVSNGEITITPSTTQGRMMITGAVAGKIIALRAKRPSTAAAGFKVWGYDGANIIGSPMLDIALGTSYQIFVLVVPIGATSVRIYPDNVAGSAPATIDWIWIGDYSYLTGTLSEEAARIANELGDTAGVAVAASGTITATDLATAGKGDTIQGKKYTFVDALTASPGVEGEVLKAATKEEEIENENLAISEVSRANNGVKYWAAAVHPLVSTTRSGAVLNISAKTPGLAGNQITVVSESGTNHTASGSTLTGGKDAVGDKIHTQLQTMPASTAKYGATKLATNAAEITAGTSANAITPGTLKDSTPSLNGIKFPATQVASADANTLDDYEEGTFSPTIIGSTVAGTQTYAAQFGFYTKIGRHVSASVYLLISAKDALIEGNALIGGLPFTSAASGARGACAIGAYSAVTFSAGYAQLTMFLGPASTSAELRQGGSGVNFKAIPVANIGAEFRLEGRFEYNV